MILCVTPNPAIDRTLRVASLQVGEVHRAESVLIAAGGKGLNVARTILALGGSPVCLGLIGGHTGALLAALAEGEGLTAQWTWMGHETRTCVILVAHGRDATVINESGSQVSPRECNVFLKEVWGRAGDAHRISVSGSLPPGFSTGKFASLLAGLVAREKSVWVDTSGAALRSALDVHGVNIKVNAMELGEVLGRAIFSAEHAIQAGRQLLQRGISSVVVTLGRDGAVWIKGSQTWAVTAPKINMVSSVGSGDAFLGGLLFALDAGFPPDLALRHGVAAGAANALHFGGGKVSGAEHQELFEKISKMSS